MGKIDIVSASAGSGKTHELTTLLKARLAEGTTRPEAVVATTFTNRAAAELQERVRTALLEADRARDAQVLTAARIGTVNSVCSRLLSDFCFELGMSPAQRVLDEVQAEVALRKAVSEVVSEDETNELVRLRAGWPDVEWQDVVREIVDRARANGMSPEDLETCAKRSSETYAGLFDPPAGDGAVLDADLRRSLQGFLAAVDTEHDNTKTTRETMQQARRLLQRLERDEAIGWHDWLRLANGKAAKKSEVLYEPVRQAANQVQRHPRMTTEGQRIIALAFGIASRSLRAYEAYKDHNGLVDFVDQETKALKLLRNKQAAARLASATDLVLVDEFQDTSPLQLAIFLDLAGIAPASVWVGDQKQAIYGFRGTDARLMDAAIEGILRDREPRTLKKSWRSRPGLVRLTSALFTRAFSRQGIGPERVHLEPAVEDEPEGLGSFVERWTTDGKGRESTGRTADLIAAGILELLADEENGVRAGRNEPARRILPGDIAVLCRTNAECDQVAGALQAVGVRAALPRDGLMKTLEALIVVAGLQLWADPGDRLATAILERILLHPDDPQGWLKRVLDAGEKGQPLDSRAAEAVRLARENNPLAGPLTVFDHVMEAIGVRECCLSWGDANERLANLDALRSHAAAYVQSRSTPGAGQGTVAGLLAWYAELGANGLDTQATVTDRDAVVVTTWHKSKGLEWPVVVLHSLASKPRGSALGVNVVADSGEIDLRAPLAGRWIRYWPRPFLRQQTRARFFGKLEKHPEQANAAAAEEKERLRLLYVTWTRARDRLVLPGGPAAFAGGILSLLSDENGVLIRDVASPPDRMGTVEMEWAGTRFPLMVRVPEVSPATPVVPEPATAVVPAGPREHPPAIINPSSLHEEGPVGRVEPIGESIQAKGKCDPAHLGDAVHGFLAADLPDLDAQARETIARGLLERWDVTGELTPADLLQVSDNLKAWAEKRWPGARWHRELSVLHRQSDGSLVRGTCDLALEIRDGWVVIDHKTLHGSRDEQLEKARTFAPQLGAYAAAIEAATGQAVTECWVHLVLAGTMAQILWEDKT